MTGITKLEGLKRTAFHEAGHAMAFLGVQKAFKDVSIVPDEEFLGVVRPRKGTNYDPNRVNWDTKNLNRIRKNIFISLGGPVSESKYSRISIKRIFAKGTDYSNILDNLDFLIEGLGFNEDIDKVADKYISYMEQVVKNYLIWNWKFVERVANNLLSFKTLSYYKVKKIVYQDQLNLEDLKNPDFREKLDAIEGPLVPSEARIL